MKENYKQFVDKLNSYIRKYYLYQLVRGLFLFLMLFLVYFGSISVLEYINYFDPRIKLILVLITLPVTLFIFVYFLAIPITRLAGISRQLSYYEVSEHLQRIYPEIKDRLINVIELAKESGSNYSSGLLEASIDQKIEDLKIFRFTDAIRFKDLKFIAMGLSGIVLLIIGVFITAPDAFTESTVRLIHFQQKFTKPAPYTFELLNTQLEIVTGESVEFKLQCKGNELPDIMYIDISGNKFMMRKENELYLYKIENVNSSVLVYFTDNKYVSNTYRINVLNKPFISSFLIEVNPPSYTNLPNEIFQNIGDLKLISGSEVKWTFKTADTDSLSILFSDSSKLITSKTDNIFGGSKTVLNDLNYRILIKNTKIQNENNLMFRIQTKSDLFPEIKVVQIRDTLYFQTFHFKGNVMDDFGFSKLNFNLKFEERDSIISIPFTPSILNQDFFYTFNFESVKSLGKSFKYFFTVADNDINNHFKQAVSETFSFNFPDYHELVSKEDSTITSMDDLFQKSARLTNELKKDFENFKLKQINSNITDWDKFQTVKDIMNKKNELENTINQINKQNRDENKFMNSFSEEKQEIVKKQQQIEELLNEVFSDDLKKLFNEFNELAKQFDLSKYEQLSKQMDSKIEDLSKQLDRNLQVLMKMKVEQKIERIIQELKNLADTEKKILQGIDKRSDIDKVTEIEKQNLELINNLEKDYSGTLELNMKLSKPLNLFKLDNEFSELKDNYSKVIENATKKSKKRVSEGIEKNIKSIDQLVFAMGQMIRKNKLKQNEENIEDLKQILENLIYVSFDQESVLNKSNSLDFNNPIIKELKVKQKDIIRQIDFIGDSLYTLAKRTPEISSIITKEMLALKSNSGSSIETLDNGNLGGSRMYQQYTITAANNLALFLSEALENIKKQQNDGGESDEDCDKPGSKGSKPGMKKLKESQNAIKEQLQQMIDQMKKGDLGKMGKSIGQTIAQQEVLQQMIHEMLNDNTVGSGAKSQLKAIDQLLEQSRKDLIDRNISSELINRQNLILSKMLEAEKSEIERDQEENRESKTATDIKKVTPEGYFEYQNSLKKDKESIQRNSFKLQPFYDVKYNQLQKRIKN